jgi:tRNA1(Val) A37 N6-methylase TrmN6
MTKKRDVSDEAAGFTADTILGGRIKILQPKRGYRVGIDPIILAAMTPLTASANILDMGCGVGAVFLCLLQRMPDLSIVGIDIQPELLTLAAENVTANGFDDNVSLIKADIKKLPTDLHGQFTHVVMNPPYFDEQKGMVSPNVIKRTANSHPQKDLQEWVRAAHRALKAKGHLTLIHETSALPLLLAAMEGRFGGTEIIPLYPRDGEPAKRVILRARKDSRAPLSCLSGVILHEGKGYSKSMQKILLRQ